MQKVEAKLRALRMDAGGPPCVMCGNGDQVAHDGDCEVGILIHHIFGSS